MSIQTTIAAHYTDLSVKLRVAADFVAENRFDVATRSLRSVASTSGVSPASFSRLARALGFEDYEQMREQARSEVSQTGPSFSEKARMLQAEAAQQGVRGLLARQSAACIDNIGALAADTDLDELECAAERLSNSRRVVLVGALGSAGIADYCAYMASWFADNWTVTGRNGTTLASALARMTADDSMLIITKSPYARRAVQAAKLAAERGATVIVLTDSHAFPGMAHATHKFIQNCDSPQFFSSYAATVVLIETLIGMILAKAGTKAETRIREVGKQNTLFEEVMEYQ